LAGTTANEKRSTKKREKWAVWCVGGVFGVVGVWGVWWGWFWGFFFVGGGGVGGWCWVLFWVGGPGTERIPSKILEKLLEAEAACGKKKVRATCLADGRVLREFKITNGLPFWVSAGTLRAGLKNRDQKKKVPPREAETRALEQGGSKKKALIQRRGMLPTDGEISRADSQIQGRAGDARRT